MTRFFLLTVLLLLPLPGRADPPKIRGVASYKEHAPIVLKATEVTSKTAQYLWDVDGGAQFVEAGDALYVWAAPGDYLVRLTTIDFEAKKVERTRFAFTVEAAIPPPPPVPPGPAPPAPPTPGGTMNRVLILYDSGALGTLPKPQEAILYDGSLRAFLKAKTLTDKDNPGGAWRIWDKSADASADGKAWVDLMGRPRAGVPWLIVSGPSGVLFEGPLPRSVADTLALLGKYASAARMRKAG